MTETVPSARLADIADRVLPYDGCGMSVSADDAQVIVLRPQPFVGIHCFERVIFERERGSMSYLVLYDADIGSARETLAQGTVLGTLGDLAQLERECDNPAQIAALYSGTYDEARAAFERVFAILLAKVTC